MKKFLKKKKANNINYLCKLIEKKKGPEVVYLKIAVYFVFWFTSQLLLWAFCLFDFVAERIPYIE